MRTKLGIDNDCTDRKPLYSHKRLSEIYLARLEAFSEKGFANQMSLVKFRGGDIVSVCFECLKELISAI